jgi:2,5-diamino-6-(ribosylamino)-4(3H)-pyrimidinone 5'-phosphate reductase
MGRKTYEYFGNDFPCAGALNIVMTSQTDIPKNNEAIFTDKSPQEVLDLIANKGFEKVLLIGGGHTNADFLSKGLIDEVFLDVHPLILGRGLNLFVGKEQKINLSLLSVEQLKKGQVLLHYQVNT